MTAHFVVNPASAGGRTGRRLSELKHLATQIFGDVVVHTTEHVGHGIALTTQACRQGAELVVAVGGDGTVNEVINGLVMSRCETAFSVLPAGTGGDLVRTLGTSANWKVALEAVRDAQPWAADAFELRCVGADGVAVRRFGFNVVGIGMAGDVVRRVNSSSKLLGGRLTFLMGTAAALGAWVPPEVVVDWLDAGGMAHQWKGRLVNLFLANGKYCGGGMLVGPHAEMSDGLFDLVVIPRAPLGTLLARTPLLYSGRIAAPEDVLAARVSWVRVRAADGGLVPVDVDGEPPGMAPVEVRCLPGAISVRAPRP